jgi:hypothetical protein
MSVGVSRTSGRLERRATDEGMGVYPSDLRLMGIALALVWHDASGAISRAAR